MATDVAMQDAPSTATADPPKPNRKVTVIWNHGNKNMKHREIWQHLIDEGLVKDLVYSAEIDIPPTADRGYVRDEIRVKFRMDEIGAQILGLNTSGFINTNYTPWYEVQRELEKDEGLCFRMTMRKQLDGEYIWEHDAGSDHCVVLRCHEPSEGASGVAAGGEVVINQGPRNEIVLPFR